MASRSRLPFRRVGCFDPRFSTGVSLLVLLTVVAAAFVWPGPVSFVLLAAVAVLSFLRVSRLDEEREVCVSLLVEDLLSGDVDVSPSGFSVVCVYGEVSVARLSRRLRRVHPVRARTGRRVPLAVTSPGSVVEWISDGVPVRLGKEELAGAVAVVDAGSGKCVEVIYGTHRRRPSAPLAVFFSSSTGSLCSWSPRFPVSTRALTRRRAAHPSTASLRPDRAG